MGSRRLGPGWGELRQQGQGQCESALLAAEEWGFPWKELGMGTGAVRGQVKQQRAPSLVQCLCTWFSWHWCFAPPQNYPLYIRSIPTENELKFHYTVHTSLDVVDEKISAMGKALVDQRELYLGLLYPTEDYKVYLSDAFCHTTVYL